MRRCDLGGAPTIDLTPPGKRASFFANNVNRMQQAAIPSPSASAAAASSSSSQNNHDKQLEEQYYQEFKSLADDEQLHSIKQIIEDDVLAPLIELHPGQNAFMVNQLILQQTKILKLKHIFIHNAKEFELFLRPSKIANNQISKLQGPLFELIQNGGVLVIDWTNFSNKEKGTYQYLLEDNNNSKN